mmetsp:Transcript_10975/g.38621  ORF Transcript_10975/g.38621 Transcript_10975/m.38621 type:complete len:628 (+) Transcript_10975:123-2006(+)
MPPSSAHASGAGTLSAEEFVRLQEQLLALKMQNYDLEEVNRRARGGGGGATSSPTLSSSPGGIAGPGFGNAGPTASALGQKFSLQFKVGAGAVSALGARGAAQFRAVAQGEGEGGCLNDAAALLAEVAPLRQNLRAALDELSAAKKAAMTAQQQAAAIATGGSEVKVPSPDDLRSMLQEGEAGAGTAAGLASVSDAVLLHVASAALRLDEARRREVATRREQAPTSLSGVEADQGNPLVQIHKQQQDMERLRDAVDKQNAQIGRLADQDASDKAARPDTLQALQDRLQATERHLAELSRRIDASDGISGQMYELRCHLTTLNERARQRDQAIERFLTRQEGLSSEQSSLVENLALAEEKVCALQLADVERLCRPAQVEEGEDEEICDEVEDLPAGTDLRVEDASGVLSSPSSPSRGSGVCVIVQAALSAPEAVEEGGESPVRGRESLEELRRQFEELRDAKLAFERCFLKFLNFLVGLFRSAKKRAEVAAEEDELGGTDGGGSSSSTARPSSGPSLLYVQKHTELEALSEGFQQDLELLRSSEQLLREDTKEKAGLIRSLMRTVHADGIAKDSLLQDHSRGHLRSRRSAQKQRSRPRCRHLGGILGRCCTRRRWLGVAGPLAARYRW